MTEIEGKAKDRQQHIMLSLLPRFADRHNIRWHFSDGIDGNGVIRYKPVGYRIDWSVNQNTVIAEVRILKRLQDCDLGDSILMFSFAIAIDEFYDWLDDYHFMRLHGFVFDHIELYWDYYLDIVNNRVWNAKLDGRLSMLINNIETEGALMGML